MTTQHNSQQDTTIYYPLAGPNDPPADAKFIRTAHENEGIRTPFKLNFFHAIAIDDKGCSFRLSIGSEWAINPKHPDFLKIKSKDSIFAKEYYIRKELKEDAARKVISETQEHPISMVLFNVFALCNFLIRKINTDKLTSGEKIALTNKAITHFFRELAPSGKSVKYKSVDTFLDAVSALYKEIDQTIDAEINDKKEIRMTPALSRTKRVSQAIDTNQLDLLDNRSSGYFPGEKNASDIIKGIQQRGITQIFQKLDGLGVMILHTIIHLADKNKAKVRESFHIKSDDFIGLLGYNLDDVTNPRRLRKTIGDQIKDMSSTYYYMQAPKEMLQPGAQLHQEFKAFGFEKTVAGAKGKTKEIWTFYTEQVTHPPSPHGGSQYRAISLKPGRHLTEHSQDKRRLSVAIKAVTHIQNELTYQSNTPKSIMLSFESLGLKSYVIKGTLDAVFPQIVDALKTIDVKADIMSCGKRAKFTIAPCI